MIIVIVLIMFALVAIGFISGYYVHEAKMNNDNRK